MSLLRFDDFQHCKPPGYLGEIHMWGNKIHWRSWASTCVLLAASHISVFYLTQLRNENSDDRGEIFVCNWIWVCDSREAHSTCIVGGAARDLNAPLSVAVGTQGKKSNGVHLQACWLCLPWYAFPMAGHTQTLLREIFCWQGGLSLVLQRGMFWSEIISSPASPYTCQGSMVKSCWLSFVLF